MKNLVLVLGDQLSRSLPSLNACAMGDTVVLMAEVQEEAAYVAHHKKKIAFIFSAMRHFARELEAHGWRVDYVKLDDPSNSGSFTGEVKRALARHQPERVVLTEPGEWRVLQMVRGWEAEFGMPVQILRDSCFLASHEDFERWAADRKQLRMEFFYREMRRSTGLLMDGAELEGGRWNFGAENRKPAGDALRMPELPRLEPDRITREVLDLVKSRFDNHFGDLEPFCFAVTSEDAERAFAHFLDQALPHFGDYQNAMLAREKFLYHSVSSLYLNIGLLDPLDMCRRAEADYRAGRAPLNAVEGFIRQIIGWREYVRGIYWLKMPGYDKLNFLEARRHLPDFYWGADTDMACVRACVAQTREESYAHHIQRLMVTGNFYEWVELPNTLGMSLFGDGGLLGSKPYAASGNYINKMSDYCKGCAYDVKLRTGPKAYPFNYLYWDFLIRNRQKLGRNPRLSQGYRTVDAMSDTKKADIRASAASFLDSLKSSYGG